MAEEDLTRRKTQIQAVHLGPGVELIYRPVRLGPANYSSQHGMTLADFSILDAGLNAGTQGFDAVCIDTMSDSDAAFDSDNPGDRTGAPCKAGRTDAG
ncbi:MAG: hypothetical protein Q4G25_12585 [Paracoccus sp. (in: a-proteobacteria)]|nr:hypothetical protein [Paracoccus sp. (in: a-proteobacteria)]